VRDRLAVWLLNLVISYLVGRRVHWISFLDGQPVVRKTGLILGGKITRDALGKPTGALLTFGERGALLRDIRRFPIEKLTYQKRLGWCIAAEDSMNDFWKVNGKTEAQDSRAGAQAVGWVVLGLIVIGVVGGIGTLLYLNGYFQ
jgi:hypothetical protein